MTQPLKMRAHVDDRGFDGYGSQESAVVTGISKGTAFGQQPIQTLARSRRFA